MTRIIRLLSLFLVIQNSAWAQPYQGYDVLGVAMYCNEYLAAPKLPAVSTLLNTFGNPLPCIEKRIANGGLALVQVDLIDATCWRNKKCPPGVAKPTDLREIEKRAKQVYAAQQRNQTVRWQVSPALEHDVRDAKTVQAMLNAAKKGCPTCEVVNSPFTGARPPGTPVELHGTKVRAWSVSSDGASMFDGDNLRSDGNGFEHRTSGSFSTYGWFNEMNLRCTGEDGFTPPLKRTAKPTAALFEQAYRVMQPEEVKPGKPGICKTVRGFESGEINKPNAEAYCNGQKDDGRGNRNLVIIKKLGKRGDKLKIYDKNGRQKGCFAYYGQYTNPRYGRWYVGSCSKQTPAQLVKDLGSEWGWIDLGKGNCLEFNAVRRLGTYR